LIFLFPQGNESANTLAQALKIRSLPGTLLRSGFSGDVGEKKPLL